MVHEWSPPPNGILKLNFDGASKGNPRPMGFWCILRDHNGSIWKVVCGSLDICNSIRAETMSLLFGLREWRKMGILDCIIEEDSEVVVGWGQGKECKAWRVWDSVYDIKELQSELRCSYVHIPQEQNSMVDSLANWGIGQSTIFIGIDIPF